LLLRLASLAVANFFDADLAALLCDHPVDEATADLADLRLELTDATLEMLLARLRCQRRFRAPAARL
jgi:hypothetical protein